MLNVKFSLIFCHNFIQRYDIANIFHKHLNSVYFYMCLRAKIHLTQMQ